MNEPTLYCSFCGKSQHEVHKLVAGPRCFICNECSELCVNLCRADTGHDYTMRFVAQFEDGRYERDMSTDRITPKARHEYYKSVGIDADDANDEHMTGNLNEARTYKTEASLRCSNVYSYRPKIIKVLVAVVKIDA